MQGFASSRGPLLQPLPLCVSPLNIAKSSKDLCPFLTVDGLTKGNLLLYLLSFTIPLSLSIGASQRTTPFSLRKTFSIILESSWMQDLKSMCKKRKGKSALAMCLATSSRQAFASSLTPTGRQRRRILAPKCPWVSQLWRWLKKKASLARAAKGPYKGAFRTAIIGATPVRK